MNPEVFSKYERILALLAGTFNAVIGFAFFFLPELVETDEFVFLLDFFLLVAPKEAVRQSEKASIYEKRRVAATKRVISSEP